jgi:hypothetical protein
LFDQEFKLKNNKHKTQKGLVIGRLKLKFVHAIIIRHGNGTGGGKFCPFQTQIHKIWVSPYPFQFHAE